MSAEPSMGTLRRSRAAARVPEDDERTIDVARLYYPGGLKIEEIAARLHLSRSTVSRELAKARRRGLVEFVLHGTPDPTAALAAAVEDRFGVRTTVVDCSAAPTAAGRLERVAERAAERLTAMVAPDTTVAVAWGRTVDAVARHLTRSPTRGTRVVQLNGSGSSATTGIHYAGRLLERFAHAFAATDHPFPVPAFFDSAATRAAMWRERSVRRLLELRAGADVMVASVGAIDADDPGRLYRPDYLDPREVAELRHRGVVGDLGGVFLRADGTAADVALNGRATGMPVDEVRAVPTRLLVVAGPDKATATLAALRAAAATDLVLDDATASQLAEEDAR